MVTSCYGWIFAYKCIDPLLKNYSSSKKNVYIFNIICQNLCNSSYHTLTSLKQIMSMIYLIQHFINHPFVYAYKKTLQNKLLYKFPIRCMCQTWMNHVATNFMNMCSRLEQIFKW
jgi:hypothetical protein